MNNVEIFALASGDAMSWTPEQMLATARNRAAEGGECEHVKKAIVIFLDDNDGYNSSFNQSGMKCSEIIALLEVVKNEFIKLI